VAAATTNAAGATPTAGAQNAVSGTPRDQQSVVEAATKKAGPAVLSVDVTGPGPVFGADPGTITATVQVAGGTALQVEVAGRARRPVTRPETTAPLLGALLAWLS